MRVGFHNHKNEFELENGMSKFDRIFSGTPNDFLVQLDIGWAAAAGQDVPAILRNYARRIETVHVKEFSEENPKAAVGEGSVDGPSGEIKNQSWPFRFVSPFSIDIRLKYYNVLIYEQNGTTSSGGGFAGSGASRASGGH